MTRTVLPALALLGAAWLAGCSHELVPSPAPPLTPTARYAIEVRPGADEIHLQPHGQLSANQQAALQALAGRWRAAGSPELVIQATSDEAAQRSAHAAAHVLHGRGVPDQALRFVQLEGEGLAVRVGYARLEAVGPSCADRWEDLTVNGHNQSAATFGCAVTANIAAQIADPRDLLAPNPVDPADARRRVSKATSYRDGDEPVEDNASPGAK